MEFPIPSDLAVEKEFVVEEKYVAAFLGSGAVDVLATPSMILLMEHISRVRTDEVLPDGFTTVGTEVCVKHLDAAPKGATVKVKSRLKKQDGRKLLFEVETWWGETKVGEGTHERFIINQERFLQRLEAKTTPQ